MLAPLKWPRSLEDHPRLAELVAILDSRRTQLWPGGTIAVATLTATPAFEELLMTLNGRGQVERGLEKIGATLNTEQRGQAALQARQGAAPAHRISRLLLIADTGSERFNRGCERLLLDHAERVLGLRLDKSGAHLVEKLYGSDALAKVLLISHRDAVAQTLLAVLAEP